RVGAGGIHANEIALDQRVDFRKLDYDTMLPVGADDVADDRVGSVRRDLDSVRIAQRPCAGYIGANIVALHDVSERTERNHYAVSGVAGDNIAGGGDGAANQIARYSAAPDNADPFTPIAERVGAGGIHA